jgi:hypothetical protein
MIARRLTISLLFLGFLVGPISAEPRRAWTFMVFMNADNDLDHLCVPNIRQMEKGTPEGGAANINVVVQVDRMEKGARRYCVTSRASGAPEDDWGVVSELKENMGTVDMGDPNELVRFARWVLANYPAEKYALVIWNHGSGWAKRGAERTVKGISYDEESGHLISTPALGAALGEIAAAMGKPIEVFGMDACFMQMMEVAYELRNHARYIVSSEETEPGAGWPYDRILAPLVENPGMEPLEFARQISVAWGQAYEFSSGTTQSAIDCQCLEGLAQAVDEVAGSLLAHTKENDSVIRAVINTVYNFEYTEHIDLGDFLKLLCERAPNIPDERQAIQKALLAYQKLVVHSSATGTGGVRLNRATGLAIYYPKFVFHQGYGELEFSKFRWDEMVQTLDKEP